MSKHSDTTQNLIAGMFGAIVSLVLIIPLMTGVIAVDTWLTFIVLIVLALLVGLLVYVVIAAVFLSLDSAREDRDRKREEDEELARYEAVQEHLEWIRPRAPRRP